MPATISEMFGYVSAIHWAWIAWTAGGSSGVSSNSSCENPSARLPIACIAWWVRSIEKPPFRRIPIIESMYPITIGVGLVRDSITCEAQG